MASVEPVGTVVEQEGRDGGWGGKETVIGGNLGDTAVFSGGVSGMEVMADGESGGGVDEGGGRAADTGREMGVGERVVGELGRDGGKGRARATEGMTRERLGVGLGGRGGKKGGR